MNRKNMNAREFLFDRTSGKQRAFQSIRYESSAKERLESPRPELLPATATTTTSNPVVNYAENAKLKLLVQQLQLRLAALQSENAALKEAQEDRENEVRELKERLATKEAYIQRELSAMREAAAAARLKEAGPRKQHSKRKSRKQQSTVSLLPAKPPTKTMNKDVTELTIALVEQMNASNALIGATSTIPPVRRPPVPLAPPSVGTADTTADSTADSTQPPASVAVPSLQAHIAEQIQASMAIVASMFDEEVITTGHSNKSAALPQSDAALRPPPPHGAKSILRTPLYPENRLKEHLQIAPPPPPQTEESSKKSSVDSSGKPKKKKKPYRSAPKRKYSDDDMPATARQHAPVRHDLPRSTSVALLAVRSATAPLEANGRAMSARQLTGMNSPETSLPAGNVEASNHRQPRQATIASSQAQTGDRSNPKAPQTNGSIFREVLPTEAPMLVRRTEERTRVREGVTCNVDPAVLELRERRRLRELACAKPPQDDDDDASSTSSSSGSTSSSSSNSTATVEHVDPAVLERRVRRLLRDLERTLPTSEDTTALLEEPDGCDCQATHAPAGPPEQVGGSSPANVAVESHQGDQAKSDLGATDVGSVTPADGLGEASGDGLPEGSSRGVGEISAKEIPVYINVTAGINASGGPQVVANETGSDGDDESLYTEMEGWSEPSVSYEELSRMHPTVEQAPRRHKLDGLEQHHKGWSEPPTLSDKYRSVSPEDSKGNPHELKDVSPRDVKQLKGLDHQHDCVETFQVSQFAFVDPYGDTGLFTGSVSLDRLPQGYGKMVYDQDGRVYEGEWKRGQWDGNGKLVNGNGDIYEGEFLDDQRHGQGTYIWKSGRRYVGDFVRDIRHGKGTFSFSDGSVYVGDFEQGARQGFGRCDFPEGGYYEGEWKNNMFEGTGECYWPDGRSYRGEFSQNQSHGWGVEKYADGRIRHDGFWNNDSPVK